MTLIMGKGRFLVFIGGHRLEEAR